MRRSPKVKFLFEFGPTTPLSLYIYFSFMFLFFFGIIAYSFDLLGEKFYGGRT